MVDTYPEWRSLQIKSGAKFIWLGVLAAVWRIGAGAARAQDNYEIQVYDSDTVAHFRVANHQSMFLQKAFTPAASASLVREILDKGRN